MEDFTRELPPGNTKAAMKAVGAASSDLWKVAPDQLRTLDGFNARIKNDAYAARVRVKFRWWTKPLLLAAGAMHAAVFRWGIKVEVDGK